MDSRRAGTLVLARRTAYEPAAAGQLRMRVPMRMGMRMDMRMC